MERKERLQALANYLGVEPSYFEEENSYDDKAFESKEYNEEYLVLTEDEARKYAEEDIKGIYDDLGLESFTPEFQEWIMNNAVNSEPFEELLDEEIDYFTTQEPDEDSLKYVQSFENNPIEYAKQLFDEEGFKNFVKEHDALDMDKIVSEAISQDGIAHFIATYDGNELDLGNGLYGYRIN